MVTVRREDDQSWPGAVFDENRENGRVIPTCAKDNSFRVSKPVWGGMGQCMGLSADWYKPVPARHAAHRPPGRIALSDDGRLLVSRPIAPPTRAGEHLNAPGSLRHRHKL